MIMTNQTITIPNNLIFESSIDFIKKLREIQQTDKITFDFKNLRRIDPFSLLYVSSEINICRKKFKNSEFQAKNYNNGNCNYMAHMGFFQAFGLDFGNRPSQAKGSNTYVPMHIYDTSEINQEAIEAMVHPAQLLENKAKEISKILTQEQSGNLNETFTYCIREILRNVIEHSETKRFGFCAQFLPTQNKVHFSILDRGIGLKKSLQNNPKLNLPDDKTAIIEALKPGVSGKVYSGQKRKPKGEWANSGYGLFMTSNICENGGSFFIASGSQGFYLNRDTNRFLNTPINGTAINLTIDTTTIKSLYEMLRDIDKKNEIQTLKPSKSSLGLIKNNVDQERNKQNNK